MGASESDTDALAEKLVPGARLTIMTGAGISAASGIPTFRGDEGLWEEYEPSELASPQGFRRDPETVWRWYDERRQMIDDADPNPGHQVLAGWEDRFDKLTLITQNVDGLHAEAGSSNVVRLHGHIWAVSCWDNCDASDSRWLNRTVPLPDIPPTCSECGGLLRPEVVWFGEQLDPGILEEAQRAVKCDVFLTIGTSAEVHPAAGFINEAAKNGAYTAEINPDSTAASNVVDRAVQARAEEFLPSLDERLPS